LPVKSGSLEKLADFVRSQVAEKATLRLELEKIQETSDRFRQELDKLKSIFRIGDSQAPISVHIARKVEKLRQLAAKGRNSQKLLNQVVSLLVQFATRNSADVNMRSSLHRLRRWISNPNAVDLPHEVDFLLGLWPPEDEAAAHDKGYRRQFIQDRLSGCLPENATWTEVCEFLIDRARHRKVS
jgi:hypothetical protein